MENSGWDYKEAHVGSTCLDKHKQHILIETGQVDCIVTVRAMASGVASTNLFVAHS